MCDNSTNELCIKIRISLMRSSGSISADYIFNSLSMLKYTYDGALINFFCEEFSSLRDAYRKKEWKSEVDYEENPEFGDFVREICRKRTFIKNDMANTLAEEITFNSPESVGHKIGVKFIDLILELEKLRDPEEYEKILEILIKIDSQDLTSFSKVKNSLVAINSLDDLAAYPKEWILSL